MNVSEYWSWWAGALALGGVTIAFYLATGRPLGVSGSWTRLASIRDERSREKTEAAMHAMPQGADDALMQATLAEFGADVAEKLMAGGPAPSAPAPVKPAAVRAPWTAHLTFLVMLMAGGLLAAFSAGGFEVTLSMDHTYTSFFGDGWSGFTFLALGGMLVGFGTQMAGGCTSGHGLSGCARLVPASLYATAMFFGTAVAVSALLEVIRHAS